MTNPTMATALVLASILIPRPACPQDSAHLERTLGWSRSPISNSALDGRLAEIAVQYRAYAPIPRIAMYDLAYPKDSAEAATLGANAVLVVTAVVQDSTELPLTRVYLVSAAGTENLAPVALRASHVPDGAVATTLGRYRLDAIYLLPLALRGTAGDLLADFAAHRQGFRLTTFTGQMPDALLQLGRLPSHSTPPPATALWAMIRREYPDLAAAVAPH